VPPIEVPFEAVLVAESFLAELHGQFRLPQAKDVLYRQAFNRERLPSDLGFSLIAKFQVGPQWSKYVYYDRLS